MDFEEILRAYHVALGRGGDAAQLEAEVRERTRSLGREMSPEQLAGHVRFPRRPAEAQVGWSRLRDKERAMLEGMSFGFADEIAGLGAAVVPGGRGYREARDEARGSSARADREQSRQRTGMRIMGGAAAPAVGGGGIGGAVLRRTGSRVLAGLAGGAGAGAVGGAVQGAGDANEVADIPASSARGAAIGAGVGGALGMGGAVLGRIAGRVLGRPTSRAVDQAVHTLDRELAVAGQSRGTIKSALQRMGRGSVVADLGSNLARAARAARNLSPALDAPGGPVEGVRARTAGTRDRVARELRSASGLAETYEPSLRAAEDGIEAVRRAHYAPLEDAFPAVAGQNIDAVLATPAVAAARRSAGVPMDRPPTFREMQDILINLRDDVSAATVAGRPGASQRARIAHDALRDAMSQDLPGFDEAQRAYYGAVSRRDAHEMGRQFASKAPHEIRAALADLPPEARDAFRQGMVDRIETRLGEQEGAGGGVASLVRPGPVGEDRLSLIAGDNSRFRDFLRSMRMREAPWGETGRLVEGNSTTGMQLADADAMMGEVPTSKEGIMAWLGDMAFGPNPADRERAANLIGQVLLAEGPEAARLFARELQQKAAMGGLFGGIGGSAAAQQTTRN